MRKLVWLLVVAAVAGCAGDDARPSDAELHATTTCDAEWRDRGLAGGICDTPCVQYVTPTDTSSATMDGKPPGPLSCHATDGNGRQVWCTDAAAFDYMGVEGCCALNGGALQGHITFALCDGE